MHSRSPAVQAAAAGHAAPPIDVEALLNSAQIVAGAFDPIEPGLRARVVRLVDWLNEQPPMSPDRKAQVELQLRKLLVTRLRVAADRKRLPGIAEERIERPIFVVGFARTGTTLLQSLLAQDPAARTPLWWHTHEPCPPPGDVPVVPERIEQTGKELDRLLELVPGLLTMHPYWDLRGHCPIEDEEIFTIDFHNAYPSLLYRVPALAMILDPSNMRDAYAFHREFLQHLQWKLEPRHWVVKGTYHQFALDALFESYPDALCLWPHRDPMEVHPSTMAITAILYGAITNWAMDFKALGPVFVEGIARSVKAAIDSPLVDDPRIVHVDFRELSRDPVGTVRRAYDHWDMPWSDIFEARMRAWLADPANRPDRYGRYPYALEPFGLSREMIETWFEDYNRRFRLGKFAS